MKSKKNNINILVIFIILAIIGLIIYIIVHNRNKKSNPATKYIPNESSDDQWQWLVFVPQYPDDISIGFTPNKDNLGNLDNNQSMDTLDFYRMNYAIGGDNIMSKNLYIDQYICSFGPPGRWNSNKFNSNINIIGITNQILPQNPVKGNIPYPGNNMTLYLLDKKTGQMDSYNISRSVTLGTNNSYIIGNVTITNKFKNTSKNYSIMDYNTIIKNCPGVGISKPVFITFY
jgi:hypothetical protein